LDDSDAYDISIYLNKTEYSIKVLNLGKWWIIKGRNYIEDDGLMAIL